ncbi:MAG TPA: biotin transporter BioY [Candidatus Gastranaerophilales bacterium]|nr:biotin transporter BioY [Candidatus Gastranaerophilales bacterium]
MLNNRILKRYQFVKFLEPFPKFRLGSFLVAIFCSFLIVIATFTPLSLGILALPEEALVNTGDFFSNLQSIDQIIRILSYIPQIPVVIMIAAMLGPRIGMLAVSLYVISGLAGFPVFASGGGVEYLERLGFGYILGFFVGTFITGKLLLKDTTAAYILKSAIFGVIAIHITGIAYLSGALFFKNESIFVILGWIWQLSGMQIVYDLLFAVVAVILGRFLRKTLWIVLD